MRSERGLDDKFAADLALEEEELGVRGEALCTMNRFALNLKDLISDDE